MLTEHAESDRDIGTVWNAPLPTAHGPLGAWAWDRRRYYLLLGGFALLHVVLAVLLPVSGDEAYYWDLSRVADWATFDQPSLVIWGMVPFRLVLGETALAIRGPAIVASFLIGVFLLPLVKRLGGSERHAARTYVLLHGMPIFFLGSAYASTDIGMITAMTAAMWAAVAIAQGERRAWWGFGLALGLGFLAKFPVVLVLPALVPALLRREVRRDLLTPTPYLAALVSCALTTPVWIWGLQHHFDNLGFQLGARHSFGGPTLRYVGELLGASALLASPPLFVAIALAWWRGWRRREPGWACLLVGAASPFVFFGLVALRERVGGHWGGPGLVFGTVALGLALRWPRKTVIAGVVFGVVCSLTLIVAALSVDSLLGIPWGRWEHLRPRVAKVVAPGIGNDKVVAELRARLRPDELIASQSYTDVHLYAFVSGGTLPTRLARVTGGQHGLASLYWYRPSTLRGRDFLFVSDRDKLERDLTPLFGSVVSEPPLVITRGGLVVRTVRFLRCHDLQRPEGVFTRLSDPS